MGRFGRHDSRVHLFHALIDGGPPFLYGRERDLQRTRQLVVCLSKERLSQALGPNTTETCNTYNMLKLTRHLFCWNPKAEYADYYERALQRTEAKTNLAAREAIMSDMALNSLEVRDGKRAAEMFQRLLKEFPGSPRKADWTENLSRARALRK